MVSCVDSLACVPSWNFVSKKSSRTFYDTCTHFATLARACFHESHVWDKSLMSVCCACVEERLAHRYARTRRAIPMGFFFFVWTDIGQFCLTRSRHNAPCGLSAPRFSPPIRAPFFARLLGSCWGTIFFVIFWPLEQLFSSSTSPSTRR
jgi:hypothetical protein